MASQENRNDLQQLQRLNDEFIETIKEQQKTIKQLREELDLFRKKYYGRS